MQVQSYLFFQGRCEEAIAFYASAIGARQTMLMRFKDAPESSMVPPGSGDKIMHAAFTIGDTTILASDGECSGTAAFQGFSLALYAADADEAAKLFDALAEGGQVRMPLAKTFWSPAFGMLADRFGIGWMVMVDAQ